MQYVISVILTILYPAKLINDTLLIDGSSKINCPPPFMLLVQVNTINYQLLLSAARSCESMQLSYPVVTNYLHCCILITSQRHKEDDDGKHCSSWCFAFTRNAILSVKQFICWVTLKLQLMWPCSLFLVRLDCDPCVNFVYFILTNEDEMRG